MAAEETIRFVSTVAIIVIFLSLQYFYKHRFQQQTTHTGQRLVGVVIILLSFILAWIWMG